MQSAHSVCAHDSHSFSACETKIFLKEIRCHFTIAHCVGMIFMLCSFIKLITIFGTIRSSSKELDSRIQIRLKAKIYFIIYLYLSVCNDSWFLDFRP
jgi:hypothetical protein